MKQTAVEWFYQRMFAKDITSVFQQAKEMEKEQIVDAYWTSYKEGQYSGDKTADEYYNETYKQQSVTDDTL
jgi:hypothetical protein